MRVSAGGSGRAMASRALFEASAGDRTVDVYVSRGASCQVSPGVYAADKNFDTGNSPSMLVVNVQSSTLVGFSAPTSRKNDSALQSPPKICPLARAGHHPQLVVVQVDSEALFVVERVPKRMLEEQGATPDRGVECGNTGMRSSSAVTQE